MKKILFLHGFYASWQCVPAVALREAFAGKQLNSTTAIPVATPTAQEVRTWENTAHI